MLKYGIRRPSKIGGKENVTVKLGVFGAGI